MTVYLPDLPSEFPDFYPFQNTANAGMKEEKKAFSVDEIVEKFLELSEDEEINWRN